MILEPIGRNTAPAIALAALQALKENEDPILLVLPADHMIEDEVSLSNSISDGEFCAESGELVTFGIIPDSPETGYGYIKRGLAR
ncbi:mannose-1-phosphate guanylyltransferase/mannose-6-phosphate isomerase, partial [Vibrio parahaemolyticus]